MQSIIGDKEPKEYLDENWDIIAMLVNRSMKNLKGDVIRRFSFEGQVEYSRPILGASPYLYSGIVWAWDSQNRKEYYLKLLESTEIVAKSTSPGGGAYGENPGARNASKFITIFVGQALKDAKGNVPVANHLIAHTVLHELAHLAQNDEWEPVGNPSGTYGTTEAERRAKEFGVLGVNDDSHAHREAYARYVAFKSSNAMLPVLKRLSVWDRLAAETRTFGIDPDLPMFNWSEARWGRWKGRWFSSLKWETPDGDSLSKTKW